MSHPSTTAATAATPAASTSPTRVQRRLLEPLLGDAVIESRRTYPFAHVHQVRSAAGNLGPLVSDDMLARLVAARWLVGRPQDALWDVIHYTLTPAGRAVVDGAPPPAPSPSGARPPA